MAEGYPCQHAPCARHLPRRTAYCPYCGTRQSAVPLRKGAPGPAAAATPAPTGANPGAPAAAATAAAPAATPAPKPAPSGAPPPATARPAPTKMPPFVAPAPKRKPWWRWPLVWLAFVGIGALIGKSQRPIDAIQSKVEAIDTLIQDCKLERARQDLPALRKLDANQARTLQAKIDQAKAECDAHAKPLQNQAGGKPSASAKPPRPAASVASEQNARRVADLQVEALFDLGGGNYKAAVEKMTQCLARLEPGNARCIELKQQAERLNRERTRCLKAGREWSDDKCSGRAKAG